MALFGESKEDKKARKEAEAQEKQSAKEMKLLSKYGLEDLSDRRDIDSVRKIAEELVGTGISEFGLTLGGGNEKDMLKLQMYYQRALVEQNFIMIRQLDRIAKLLEK